MTDKPNVPHHYKRRPTDYPSWKKPKYGWRDDNGKPIHEIDANGTPVCGRRSNRTGKPCQISNALCPNGRCAVPSHGGKNPGRPIVHGKASRFLPVRLMADYERIRDDDVLATVRDNSRAGTPRS